MHNRFRFALAAALFLAVALTPSAIGAEGGEEVKVGYDKGFYLRSEKFSLTLGGRVQFRFTRPDLEAAAEEEDAEGSFTVPRARLTLGGHVYSPDVKYFIQYDLRGLNTVTGVTATDTDASGDIDSVSTSRRRTPSLRDFWVELAKYHQAQLRVGQFKVPFGNQELTSSGSQQFVDRSIASGAFAPARDQGTMVFGTFAGRKFGYMASVTNGNGENNAANDNEEFRYAVRVNFDPNGEYRLEEGAGDHPEKFNWTIGGAWTQSADDNAGDFDTMRTNLFFGMKYKPVSVLFEWYDETAESAGGDVDADGYVAQAGLFVIPKKLEVAVRRSKVDPNTDLDDDQLEETRVAIGWFWMKHNYKLQLDYGQIEGPEGTTSTARSLAGLTGVSRPDAAVTDVLKDKEFRGQLQIRF